MVTLALVYLFTYSTQSIFYYPDTVWYRIFAIVGLVIWVIFAVDLIFRFALTKPKKGFARKNWLDILTVVLPQFRALRALRAFVGDGFLGKKGALSGKAVVSAIAGTVVVVWVGSLMVLNAERDAPGATITSFGDAVWWAMETITTVGYGDYVPVTSDGRLFAVIVMFVGISLVGVVSAGLSATLVKQGNAAAASAASSTPASAPTTTTTAPAPQETSSNDEVLAQIAELKAMVQQLSARLPQQ